MNKGLTVFYNGAYKENPDKFPRQVARMRAVGKEAKELGTQTSFVPIYFDGKSPEQIQKNLVEQFKNRVVKVLDDGKIFLGGDGFVGAASDALGEVKNQLPVAEMEAMDQKPVLVVKGGSLNLLSRFLGTDSVDVVKKYLMNVDLTVQEVKRRVLEVLVKEGGAELNSKEVVFKQNFPFTMFVGAGTDAIMTKRQEEQPRDKHWVKGLLKVIAESTADFWLRKGKANVDALLTIPSFDLIRFPGSKLALDKDYFYSFNVSGENALETSYKLLAGHLLLNNRHFSERIFERFEDRDWRKKQLIDPMPEALLSEYDLKKTDGWKNREFTRNTEEGLCFHIDGFPRVIPLIDDEVAVLSTQTKSGVPLRLAKFSQ